MTDFPVHPFRSRPLATLAAFLLVLASFAPIHAADPPAPAAASTAAAQAAPDGASQSSDARDALRKAVTYHREAKDLSLKFKASIYNAALEKRDRYEGKLLLKGADRFRLEIPGGSYVSDGTTYWEYHPQNGQVIVRRAKDMEDKPLPGEVLLRFLDSDPRSIAKAADDGKVYLELGLDPSRAMKNLDSLSVLLDPRTYSVHRITSRDVSGNEAEYTVTSIRRNAGLKDREFAFKTPKGAEVVDMRE